MLLIDICFLLFKGLLVGEPPLQKQKSPFKWALPVRGGWGLSACRDGLWYLVFREELSKFKWTFNSFFWGGY